MFEKLVHVVRIFRKSLTIKAIILRASLGGINAKADYMREEALQATDMKVLMKHLLNMKRVTIGVYACAETTALRYTCELLCLQESIRQAACRR